jgi:hypothetical protein
MPKLINHDNPHVIGIRDTESVLSFQDRLKTCKHILLVGNGGIALELAHEIENCKITWVVKHDHIGHAFFDSLAAKFFLDKLNENKKVSILPVKRLKYTIESWYLNLNVEPYYQFELWTFLLKKSTWKPLKSHRFMEMHWVQIGLLA